MTRKNKTLMEEFDVVCSLTAEAWRAHDRTPWWDEDQRAALRRVAVALTDRVVALHRSVQEALRTQALAAIAEARP